MTTARTRAAVIHLLIVGALLGTGCPQQGTGPTTGTIGLAGAGKGRGERPQSPAANPGADRPSTPNLPTEPTGPQPQVPEVPATTPVPELPAITPGQSFLGGLVTAPAKIISNNGGSIISNNGSNILSNNGGGIISNNGGSIVSNNGGSIISNSGNTYRLLEAAGAEGTLKNAFLYLTDRDERFFRHAETSQVFTATTDASGNYRFDIKEGSGFPLGKDVVVNALINGNLRMTGYIAPIEGENQLKLNLGTTVATEFLRGEAYRSGKALKNFDRALFYQTVSMTQQAINTGDIEAIKTVKNHDGTNVTVGTFDLRVDHVFNLRNQYAVAISAVSKANATIKALSDNWKTLFGFRPTAVTTLIGNGAVPRVNPAWAPDDSGFGGVEGDHRLTTEAQRLAGPQIPMGFAYGVAVAKRGDVFVSGYSEVANSGFIRWIKPDGSIQSLWLPTYNVAAPAGICVEQEPSDAAPGRLLVVDSLLNYVLRVPIVDAPQVGADGYEVFPMEIVAGEETPLFSERFDPHHPNFVDAKRVGADPVDAENTPITPYNPGSGGNYWRKVPKHYAPVDTEVAAQSRWRLGDEGDRTYVDGNVGSNDAAATGVTHAAGESVPNAARYAHLNRPQDVEVDELGNIYIADRANHRVRMIPKVAGTYYGYRAPTGMNADGTLNIPTSGPLTPMKAGCIYTIVGNPSWDPAKTNNEGGFWFGEFAGSDSVAEGAAQRAKLDQPYALAFDAKSKTLYIADYDNQRVRAVSRANGAIRTAAGNTDGLSQRGTGGDRDYAPADLAGGLTGGDGGLATQARLSFPRGIAVDAQGRLYIADTASGRIRMVDANGVITTIAGRKHDPANPRPTDNVTDGDALNWVDLWETEFIDVEPSGNLLYADLRHLRVRKLWRQWE